MKRLLALGLTGLLASCAVGPDFKRPAPPAVQSYTASSLPGVVAAGRDLPAEWWVMFQSPALDALVKQALAANPNLAAAKASLRQAHELAAAQRTAFFPTLSGDLTQLRGKNAQNSIAPPTQLTDPYYSLYTAQLSLSYAPDFWGATRRAAETAEAQEQGSRFQYEAAYITLSANVVVTVIEEASFRAQLAADRRLLAIAHELTEKLERQRAIGTASELDLLAQRSIEAQMAQVLPPLEKQLAQTRDALAALLGVTPVELTGDMIALDDLTLPAELPLSLPAKLVEQRPDVRQAEEAMHAASAEVGVAVAAMLPDITLTGALGTGALTPSKLFTGGNGFWSVGSSLTQTLFDSGALLHKRRAAAAALDAAGAQYRAAVLGAFQNVADALEALRTDADAQQAAAMADQAAKKSFDLARRQRDIGMINLVNLLNAEQNYQQAEISLIASRAARLSDSAGLFLALGGGWWNRQKEAEAE